MPSRSSKSSVLGKVKKRSQSHPDNNNNNNIIEISNSKNPSEWIPSIERRENKFISTITKFKTSLRNDARRVDHVRVLARRLLRRSLSTSLGYPLSIFRRVRHWRIPLLRKPPQLVRWDLLGVLSSHLWGSLGRWPLPKFLRKPLYSTWAYIFKCNLDEIRFPLENYSTFCDFFSRTLKDGSRTIAAEGMVSPVDGLIVSLGEVLSDRVEQVKGVTYTVSGFLGSDISACRLLPPSCSKLYHCVIYLAPGDYHRIHSPLDWVVKRRRHFPGTLFPIAPTVGKLIPNLLSLNERVVLIGSRVLEKNSAPDFSDSAYFSLTAVGAYNVGSIQINFDQNFRTNEIYRDFRCPNLQYFSYQGVGSYAHQQDFLAPIKLKKGEELGTFNLGSTVVLIFESSHFEFSVKVGDRILMGEKLGLDLDQP